MIRELLEQRINDYSIITKHILGLYEQKLIKALRFYTKTDRKLNIKTVEFFPLNKNFIVYTFYAELLAGDKIKMPDGSIVEINSTNFSEYVSEPIKLVMSIESVETYTAVELYELLKKIDAFIKEYGKNTYQKGLESGIIRFEELLENSDHVEIYDSPENSLESIKETLDDLQKLELDVYIKNINENRTLN